jgi:hypothetical protein
MAAHALVTEARVTEAWKLRGVCRTFAAEITHDVFAKQPREAFVAVDGKPVAARNIIKHDLGLFVDNHLTLRLDIHEGPLTRLRNMVDTRCALDNDVNMTDNSKQRLQHMRQLCDGLEQVLGSTGILHQLLCSEEAQRVWKMGLYPALVCGCGLDDMRDNPNTVLGDNHSILHALLLACLANGSYD